MVDWSQPLEAVHEDGRVVAVELVENRRQPDDDGDYLIDPPNGMITAGIPAYLNAGGASAYGKSPWTIRNRQPATQDIPAEIVERMVANNKRVAEMVIWTHTPDDERAPILEARALDALLPKPIDPDKAEANEMADGAAYWSSIELNDAARLLALKALKRGRELGSAK